MSPNDPSLRSFIEAGPQSDFPIQNLPYGVFSTPADPRARVGVAIGDFILDLAALEKRGLLRPGGAAGVFDADALNPLMALGPRVWSQTRARISELLAAGTPTLRDDADLRGQALVPRASARLQLPFKVAAFSDFYSSRQHASNAGAILRGPNTPLMPNWLHMPIGYNSRASTVVVSGTPIRRPLGQTRAPDAPLPAMGPCAKLDFELEMGFVLGADSPMGEMLTESAAADMIFGFMLLNDWSARDIQAWEYQPLGPFLAKAFATTISPWVVTAEALEPFRVEGPVQEPAPLPYLRQSPRRNYDVTLEAWLKTKSMPKHVRIAHSNFKDMYWSSVQQLMHHASTGCAMSRGDLLGSGTISGDAKDERGSMLELSWNGTAPLALPNGESRSFLEDGDSLLFRGYAQGETYRIGFGEAEGTILPARALPSQS
jgi:fumarylacetoacetase